MKKILSIAVFVLMALGAWAVPANPRPMNYVQPNGDTITIRLVGDEHFHFNITVDGYLIQKNSKGYYCYATWQEKKDEKGETYRVPVATRRKVHNADKRSKCEQRWLKRQAEKGKNVRK